MIAYEPNHTSNHPHRLPFVIQGYDNTRQTWDDSRHGGATIAAALAYAQENGAWFAMSRTRLRIVRSAHHSKTAA
jgi:hypothetical protein